MKYENRGNLKSSPRPGNFIHCTRELLEYKCAWKRIVRYLRTDDELDIKIITQLNCKNGNLLLSVFDHSKTEHNSDIIGVLP